MGLPGRLIAEVTATRQSTHIGDWGRGLYPQTPAVGERIVLGRGRLFCQTVDRDSPHPVIEAVGLAPEDVDDRDTDWLDMRRQPDPLIRIRGHAIRRRRRTPA